MTVGIVSAIGRGRWMDRVGMFIALLGVSAPPFWLGLLLLYWFCVPLAIFCVARSRLQLYVLPLFVPLALLCARPLASWAWLDGRRLARIAVATAVALLALKGALAYAPSDRDSRRTAAEIAGVLDTHGIEELAFVGMRPFYGLELYLGRNVGAMHFSEKASTTRNSSRAGPGARYWRHAGTTSMRSSSAARTSSSPPSPAAAD